MLRERKSTVRDEANTTGGISRRRPPNFGPSLPAPPTPASDCASASCTIGAPGPRYFPTDTLPFWITKFRLPEAVADDPVFFTVTVHGPLPRSRVDEPPIDVCAVDEHFTNNSCELESRLMSFTAKAAGAATARMERRKWNFIRRESNRRPQWKQLPAFIMVPLLDRRATVSRTNCPN